MARPDATGRDAAETPERRTSPRVARSLAASVAPVTGGGPVAGRAFNIGAGGLGIALMGSVVPRAACRLTLALPDGAMLGDLPVEVVWCTASPGDGALTHRAGLVFAGLSDEQRAALGALMNRQA